MEHLVRFMSAEGREGQHRADTLDDALAFVERLRNSEEASDVRVYRMEEVPIEFRTYYKVELGYGEQPSTGGGHADNDAEAAQPVHAAAPDGPAANAEPGNRRLFARG